ncbi:hypothetical protein [Actinomadura parmotrematis]|uniref:DUF2178 domain-containing protein n=1 Tax=Actinomadura parmotrematis TaxID=2864039 RepID=A0ABS7FZH2_9ACTN|nr:hypothetical protein [Actinomadura parmotrematis]MBW8485701.1 hypothetical protein [Actinomadura parmotrematis]
MSTREIGRGRWLVPATCVLLAAAYAVVFLLNDEPAMAAVGAGVMLAYGAFLLLFGGRSEAVALLGGKEGDERRRLIALRASAATGQLLVVVAVAMLFVKLAQGDDPGAWATICAVGGAAFITSIVYYTRRN